ncbi:GDSL esterase/lipase 7 [Citrus sinensis]|uniref:GDSL esterase/lipase 7 n=1 Tax=Citrus sinensis TaxID=2711 RepID=A0ACB8K4Z9_CITSI|nr:GDSL esterase/lipase 7 [Citrus sinensis]
MSYGRNRQSLLSGPRSCPFFAVQTAARLPPHPDAPGPLVPWDETETETESGAPIMSYGPFFAAPEAVRYSPPGAPAADRTRPNPTTSPAVATTQLAPALYVFGDSLFDSGNNNFLPTAARANYLPYGANFVNRSTGRFTNGKTVADFIAEFLGLPYSPPFLSYKRDLLPLTGLNYASGSCGILPETGSPFRLYNLGARKIVVFELGPIGCLPWITRNNKHTGQCVEDTNQIVSYFNNMLPAMLQNLTTSLKGSNFINGHGHGVGYDAIINPSKYGIADASNPCCTAFFNGTSGCIPYLRPCNNTNKHYFWDGYHPTEVVYSILASGCINNASFCTPYSLKDLVKV